MDLKRVRFSFGSRAFAPRFFFLLTALDWLSLRGAWVQLQAIWSGSHSGPRMRLLCSPIFHQAKTLLGSAYSIILNLLYNAQQGKYGYVKNWSACDLVTRACRCYHLFRLGCWQAEKPPSSLTPLEWCGERFQEALDKQRASVISQNPAAAILLIYNVRICGWTGQCRSMWCQPLRYHQYSEELRCHYCGYKRKPSSCPPCGSTKLNYMEWELSELTESLSFAFPWARMEEWIWILLEIKYGYSTTYWWIWRWDNLDIWSYNRWFTKGLDFGRVTVVGIWGRSILNFPETPSWRTSHISKLTPSCRPSRSKRRSKVRSFIQTRNPETYLLRASNQRGLNKEFFRQEMIRIGRILIISLRQSDQESPLGML